MRPKHNDWFHLSEDTYCDALLTEASEIAKQPYARALAIWVAILSSANRSGGICEFAPRALAKHLDLDAAAVTQILEAFLGLGLISKEREVKRWSQRSTQIRRWFCCYNDEHVSPRMIEAAHLADGRVAEVLAIWITIQCLASVQNAEEKGKFTAHPRIVAKWMGLSQHVVENVLKAFHKIGMTRGDVIIEWAQSQPAKRFDLSTPRSRASRARKREAAAAQVPGASAQATGATLNEEPRPPSASASTPDTIAAPGAQSSTPAAQSATPGATRATPGATRATPGATSVTPGATSATPSRGEGEREGERESESASPSRSPPDSAPAGAGGRARGEDEFQIEKIMEALGKAGDQSVVRKGLHVIRSLVREGLDFELDVLDGLREFSRGMNGAVVQSLAVGAVSKNLREYRQRRLAAASHRAAPSPAAHNKAADAMRALR